MENHVVLITEQNVPIRTAPKLETHNKNTPLHRGLSVFIFNKSGQLLLQQRSGTKKTWPNIWSNSCCGHPQLNEDILDAAKRHLKHELGLQPSNLIMILPNYRYRFEKDNVVENEICPVMVAFSEETPLLNPDEVKDFKWIKWEKWLEEVTKNPDSYSPWCVEETLLLSKSPKLTEFLKNIYQAI